MHCEASPEHQEGGALGSFAVSGECLPTFRFERNTALRARKDHHHMARASCTG